MRFLKAGVLCVVFVCVLAGPALADPHVMTLAGPDGVAQDFEQAQTKTAPNVLPDSFAVSRSGYIYFIDGARIRRIDPGLRMVETVAGNGQRGYGSDGPALKVPLDPRSLAIEPGTESVYFIDGGTRIRSLTYRETTVVTVAGNGGKEYLASGDAKTMPLTAWELAFSPHGYLYFTEGLDGPTRILFLAGAQMQRLAGTGLREYNGDGSAREINITPRNLTFDPHGNLFFIDNGSARIRVLDADGTKIGTYAGTGFRDFNKDRPASMANIDPHQIAMSPSGELHFVGQNRIRKVNARGVVETVAGTGNTPFMGRADRQTGRIIPQVENLTNGYDQDGFPALASNMNPIAFAFDRNGNIVFNDGYTRLRRVVFGGVGQGSVIHGVAGNRFANFNGDGKVPHPNIGPGTRLFAGSENQGIFFTDWDLGTTRLRVVRG